MHIEKGREERMKYQIIIAVLIVLIFCMIPVSAFEVRDGDSLVISTPIPDDLLISGGTVTINAPVKSVTFAGGTLIVNAPIDENLIAAGGEIQVNAPVGADIITAGGKIDLNNEVGGKVLAAGGQVSMNGKTSNVAVSGGKVIMGNSSHITGDALISASGFTPGGQVDGKLEVNSNKQGVSPSLNIEKVGEVISTLILVIHILFAIGMLILGIILIRVIPGPCKAVITTIREKTLISLIFGIVEVIIAAILILILLITLVGIPIALVIGLTTLIGLIIAPLFTGAALGTVIIEKMGKNYSLILSFALGFIILEILFLIPILGFFIEIIAVFIGLGALMMTIWDGIEVHA